MDAMENWEDSQSMDDFMKDLGIDELDDVPNKCPFILEYLVNENKRTLKN